MAKQSEGNETIDYSTSALVLWHYHIFHFTLPHLHGDWNKVNVDDAFKPMYRVHQYDSTPPLIYRQIQLCKNKNANPITSV